MSMSTDSKPVEISLGDDAGKTAQNLLAAAERLKLDPSVVVFNSKGYFVVPADVATEADEYVERDEDADLTSLKAKQLDELAEAEDIDLTGAVQSKATRIARIEEVRTERQAEADKVAADDTNDSTSSTEGADNTEAQE